MCERKATPMRRMAWRNGPTGVKEHGMHEAGFPRNLGDLVLSISNCRAGIPGEQLQARGRGVRPPREIRNLGRRDGTAKRRQRSAAGWMARSRMAS